MALSQLKRHSTLGKILKSQHSLINIFRSSSSDDIGSDSVEIADSEGTVVDSEMNSGAATAFVDILRKGERQPFSKMIRTSKLCQLGDIDGRVVIGRIVNRVYDDLYIDFGAKFEAVCKVPQLQPMEYWRGRSVYLRLHDLELSERFLGAKRDLTLLEADATLIGLYSQDVTTEKSPTQQQNTASPVHSV